MEKLGLPAEQDYEGKKIRTIGIYSKNREEWFFTDVACWMINVTNVPLYDTLGEESICWTFEQTLLSTIFLASEGIPKLVEIYKKGTIKTLKNLITFDEITPEIKASVEEVGLKVIIYKDLIESGKKETEIELKPCGPEDIMTICYTSGTTAKAKGVILLHRNFRNNASCGIRSGVLHGYKRGFTFLSYLPLAHVFERMVFYVCLISEFKVGFFHGSINELKDDVVAAKPHVLIGVPRVFCRFYDGMMKSINAQTGFKRKLLQSAMSTKLENYKATGDVTHWLYDKIALSKIRDAFGGRIHTIVSAAAPMDDNMSSIIKILLSCKYIQGYGQTESAGCISLSYYDDFLSGSLGPPAACLVAKVIDVPEMNYFSTDMTNGKNTPRGELCIKGSNLTPGYFKDPAKTAELYDKDGWMHTGDIAVLTTTGCLKIIDRAKNIFKLQHGEYISPEKIENVLSTSPWILQQFVYGDSYKTYLVAVIVPQNTEVMKWAQEKNIPGTYEELCNNEELKKTILKDLERLGRDKNVILIMTL